MKSPSLLIAKNLFNIFKKNIIISILLTGISFIILKTIKPNVLIIWIFFLSSFIYSFYVSLQAKYFIASSGNIKGFNFKYFSSLPIKKEELITGLFLGTFVQSLPVLFFIAIYNGFLAKLFFLKTNPILTLTFFSVCLFFIFSFFNISLLRAEILKPRMGLQKIDSWSNNLEIFMGLLLTLLIIRIINKFPAYLNEDFIYDKILLTWKILPILILLNLLTAFSTLRLMNNEKACYRAPLLQSTFKKIMFFVVSLGLAISFISV